MIFTGSFIRFKWYLQDRLHNLHVLLKIFTCFLQEYLKTCKWVKSMEIIIYSIFLTIYMLFTCFYMVCKFSTFPVTCSGMSPDLRKGCSLSDDCSKITCKMDFVEKPITFKLKVFILMVLVPTEY